MYGCMYIQVLWYTYIADSISMWGLHNIAIAIAISTRNDGHCQEFFRVLIFCTVRRKNCFFCQPKYTECIYIYIYVCTYVCRCVYVYIPHVCIFFGNSCGDKLKRKAAKVLKSFFAFFNIFFFHSIFMIFNHSAFFWAFGTNNNNNNHNNSNENSHTIFI